MKQFNINDYIYIQITEEGWAHLAKTVSKCYVENCIKDNRIKIKNDIWYKLQCHEVFSLFPIRLWAPPLFSPRIMFDDGSLHSIANSDKEGLQGFEEATNGI
jgi:hypothetical protein